MLEANQLSSYIFMFQEAVSPLAVNINSVGRERKTSDYSFAGLTRDDSGGAYLFQYTVAGRAAIRVRDQVYKLDAGKAFFIPFASDYHYYLPADSDNYECLFMSVDGDEAQRCWAYASEQLGPVHTYPDHSAPIRLLGHIYQEATGKKITDTYKLSMLGYQFLMELFRYARGLGMSRVWPEALVRAVRLIDEAFADIRGLDELADRVGLSKFHLIKLFNQYVGKTPIEYVTRKRMEKAVELLKTTGLPLDRISEQIGYSDVNYFSKVFRKAFGFPPGKVRKEYGSYDFMFD